MPRYGAQFLLAICYLVYLSDAQLDQEAASTATTRTPLGLTQGIPRRQTSYFIQYVTLYLYDPTFSTSRLSAPVKHYCIPTLDMPRLSFDHLRGAKGLKILTLNARSLEKKVEQLSKLAYGLDYICIS